ncbi:bifunctional tRNA pseudouridine(32) synthase/23S rRNA pseudouridine(746) synthase RluA [Desulfovibrionales bacterium]
MTKPSALPPLRYAPPDGPLDILHADKDMVVVHKPSGLLSVPGRTPDLQDSVLTRVLALYPQAQAVHRLDLGTSGVLVFATRRKAEANLRQQFQDRRTRKVYLAMVHGQVLHDHGQIDLPLICDWPNRPRQKVCPTTGKPACTDFSVVERLTQATLVRLVPHTGRSHQLRVHMAHLGHPILGDPLYGPDPEPVERLSLHAFQLGLYHPYSDQWMSFVAPCSFAPQCAPTVLEPGKTP